MKAFTTKKTNLSFQFDLFDIIDGLNRQKNGKAVGPDNIAMEALKFGGHRLCIHICLLFNFFIKHCHIPTPFMQSIVIPLVKNKSGNLSDKDNYRAIAICTAISKVFESVIMVYVSTSDNEYDSYQFGFKKQRHSTALCTNVVKRTVDYYTSRESHIFCVSLILVKHSIKLTTGNCL